MDNSGIGFVATASVTHRCNALTCTYHMAAEGVLHCLHVMTGLDNTHEVQLANFIVHHHQPIGSALHGRAGAGSKTLNTAPFVPRSTTQTLTRLYGLDLLADSTEHLLIQAVELIKAAPCTTLHQTNKDAGHRPKVKLLVAVEHQDLSLHASAHLLRLGDHDLYTSIG